MGDPKGTGRSSRAPLGSTGQLHILQRGRLDSNSPRLEISWGPEPAAGSHPGVRFEYSGDKAEFAESAERPPRSPSREAISSRDGFRVQRHSALPPVLLRHHSRPCYPLTGQEQHSQTHQLGFSLGGPIRRDRVFFFSAYENSLDRRPVLQTRSVPNLKMRQGDFPSFWNAQAPSLFETRSPGRPLLKRHPLQSPSTRVIAWQESYIPKPNFGESGRFQPELQECLRRSDNFIRRPIAWTLTFPSGTTCTSACTTLGGY